MEDKVQQYRQPLVTAAGVFLGFALNVANTWVSKAFSVDRFKEVITAIGLCSCIVLLIIVIYRILNMNYPKDRAAAYYQRTLYLFIAALSVAFLAIFLVMIESFVVHKT